MSPWSALKSWAYLDKLLHFGLCSLMGALLVFVGVPAWASVVSCWALAGGKEWFYDRPRPTQHTFDGWDAHWTFTGGLWGTFGYLPLTLLY